MGIYEHGYLCDHHSNSRISLTPEILSGRFWSDEISQYNFSGAESFTCTAKWSLRWSTIMYFLNKSHCFSVLWKYHSDNSLDTFAFHLSWWMRKRSKPCFWGLTGTTACKAVCFLTTWAVCLNYWNWARTTLLFSVIVYSLGVKCLFVSALPVLWLHSKTWYVLLHLCSVDGSHTEKPWRSKPKPTKPTTRKWKHLCLGRDI